MEQWSLTLAGASPPHPQWGVLEPWPILNSWFQHPMCFGGPKNLMCFDGPTYVSPLRKPHVVWWTENPHVFWWTLPLLKPHVLWWTQNLMCFDGPTCVSPVPKPHVVWWTQNPHVFCWTLYLMCFDGPEGSIKSHECREVGFLVTYNDIRSWLLGTPNFGPW